MLPSSAVCFMTMVRFTYCARNNIVHVFCFNRSEHEMFPTGAPFILSTCDPLQVVANTGEFCLIYDTHGTLFHTKSSKREDFKTCDFRSGDFCYEMKMCVQKLHPTLITRLAMLTTTTNDRILINKRQTAYPTNSSFYTPIS